MNAETDEMMCCAMNEGERDASGGMAVVQDSDGVGVYMDGSDGEVQDDDIVNMDFVSHETRVVKIEMMMMIKMMVMMIKMIRKGRRVR